MTNLAEVHKKFTHRDKLEIICAWELMYGQRPTIGVVPFLDKDMVVSALLERLGGGPNIDGVNSLLRKLGTLVRNIDVKTKTADTWMNDGSRQLVVVGRTMTVAIERYDEEGNVRTEELVFQI